MIGSSHARLFGRSVCKHDDSRAIRNDLLLHDAEQGHLALWISQCLDANAFAEMQKGRGRCALIDRLDSAPLGDTARTYLAKLAVRYRARADNRACAQVARVRRVRKQLVETKSHFSCRHESEQFIVASDFHP